MCIFCERITNHDLNQRTNLDTKQTLRQTIGIGDECHVIQFQEPGRAERAFARYDYLTVMKKFLLMTDREMVAPPDMEIIDYLKTPWSVPSWITEEELEVYADKFEESGFTGPLNYYCSMDLNWELLAPWQGSKITVPTKFIVKRQRYRFRISFDKHSIARRKFLSVCMGISVFLCCNNFYLQYIEDL